MPQKVLHLSDLHFGADHAFLMSGQKPIPGEVEIDLADAIADDLELQGIEGVEALIISGDIMTHARWVDHGENACNALNKLLKRINVSSENLFIVPGNHDYEWYQEDEGRWVRKALEQNTTANFGHTVQFNNFLREIRADKFYEFPSIQSLELKDYTLKIGLLDSCKITATQFHEYGLLSYGQIKEMERGFNKGLEKPEVRAIVLHHHVTSIIPAEPPQQEASVSVTLDAGRLLDSCLNLGVSLFFHGHQHYPCISRINKSYLENGALNPLSNNNIYILSGGSVGVKRNRLMPQISNTYSIIKFDAADANIRVRKIFSNRTEGSTYFETTVPLYIH